MNAVTLTQELVRVDTTNPPGNESTIIALLEPVLRGAGFETRVVPYHDGPNRSHLVARLRGSGGRPGLLFSGHVDVVPTGGVPWTVPPFGGELREDRLYGRGSCDMKGGVAALVTAACRVAQSGLPLAGDLVLAITADEERNCLGADELVKEPLFDGVGAALVAEPTGLQLFTAEKGALWLEVTLSGKTAHGSMPHLGANAIAPMARFLVRWSDYYAALPEEHPLLGKPTLNSGTIHGGVKANVVPDRCVAELDMRTVPPLDHHTLLRQAELFLKEICAEHPGVRFETRMLSDRPAIACPEDSPLAVALAGAVRDLAGVEPRPQGVPYCTEACIWVPHLNIPAVICGPGEPGMAHQPDEWVSVTQLEQAAAVYERVARDLLDH